MNNEKKKLLDGCVKSGVSPILVEDLDPKSLKNCVILDSDCDSSLLNGHYKGINFVAPDWYNELSKKADKDIVFLIINNINKVSFDEQRKFNEIFKYKKISTFNLPDNCVVLASASNLNNNPLAEDVFSLMAKI